MHGLGHVLKLLSFDIGPLGDLALLVVALGAAWLGYRYSRPNYTRPSHRALSIRRPPES
jgi:hypothetical protein